MSKPIRVQLSRKKGWKMPPNTVSVARPTKWGNPFKVGDPEPHTGETMTAQHAVDRFKQYAGQRPIEKEIERELRGKNLACWCPLWTCNKCGGHPNTASATKLVGHGCCCGGEYQRTPCHADVLLEVANS